MSFLFWRDIYNKNEDTMKIAIVILFILLFYERGRKNLEAMTLDAIALVLGVVALVVKTIRLIKRKGENE